MDYNLDQRIEQAHADAERVEAEARQIEARILKTGGIPPTRPYGRPVDPAAIKKNLTLVALLNRRDPQLASYLGVQTGYAANQQAEQEARRAEAERIQAATDRLRAVNQAAAAARYQQQLSPIPSEWRR
jgi:hypothetical protein